MIHFCSSCGAKNEYRGVKPATCRFCDSSTDPLKNFKPVQPAVVASASTATQPRRAQATTPRKINRWGTEGNVVMSEEELADAGDGETLESIGIDRHSFAMKIEGDADRPMTVKALAESQGASFTRPHLSREESDAQQEAMKHMLKPQ